MRVYEKWDKVANRDAYLRVSVISRCNSWHRRRSTARRHEDDFRDEAIHHDRPHELADALDVLSKKRRTIIVLRYYEHLTTAEIAAEMRISDGTVKSNLNRALAQLKGILQ